LLFNRQLLQGEEKIVLRVVKSVFSFIISGLYFHQQRFESVSQRGIPFTMVKHFAEID